MTGRAEIQALFRSGRRVERPAVVLLWRTTESSRRVAFAVSRQVRTAVARNRARRRVREAFRRVRQVAPEGVELVVVAKPTVLTMSFPALCTELEAAFRSIPGEGARRESR